MIGQFQDDRQSVGRSVCAARAIAAGVIPDGDPTDKTGASVVAEPRRLLKGLGVRCRRLAHHHHRHQDRVLTQYVARYPRPVGSAVCKSALFFSGNLP
jgi:hypothetical protein